MEVRVEVEVELVVLVEMEDLEDSMGLAWLVGKKVVQNTRVCVLNL